MTSSSLPHPFRPFLWLAAFAFIVGFAGFLALGGGSAGTASDAGAALAQAGLSDDV